MRDCLSTTLAQLANENMRSVARVAAHAFQASSAVFCAKRNQARDHFAPGTDNATYGPVSVDRQAACGKRIRRLQEAGPKTLLVINVQQVCFYQAS